jgi:hypothetical protein
MSSHSTKAQSKAVVRSAIPDCAKRSRARRSQAPVKWPIASVSAAAEIRGYGYGRCAPSAEDSPGQ